MQSADVSDSERGNATNAPRDRLISLALFIITLAVYWPAAHYEFNNFDDAQYITKNPAVQHGFTAHSIAWAFTSGYAGNWHPLTWLSHMLDWKLYGANAGGHHLTNLLLHAANGVLLFWLFRLMTGAAWRSAFVAALFAWHPVHVESVAWVAERKDVLSGFFGLLTLLAYYFYTRKPDSKRYALVLILFALGLMSKPMLVTLPIVMLLLDLWPLRRIYDLRFTIDEPKAGGVGKQHFGRLMLEKIPLFALTALSCLITMRVQKSGGAMSLTTLTFGERIANAVNSYVTYVGKILWPHDLAVFYPYPGHLPLAQVAGAALLLLAITIVVFWSGKKFPHLVTGWLWFLIMLLPVIGLVQVGEQALADRYTYLPAIGLFVMLAWQAPELLAKWPRAKPAVAFAGCALAVACLAGASRQIPYWRNSGTLFSHALDVTHDNALAHCNLGEALAVEHKSDEALAHFDKALALKPDYLQVINNKGSLFRQLGKLDDAAAQFILALKLKPDWSLAHRNLGLVYLDQNRLDDAIAQFRAATQSDPTDDQAFTNLGLALARQGKLDDAIAQYRKALAITPNAFAENGLGGAFELQGKLDDAAQHYGAAVAIKPDFAEAHNNLGVILNQRAMFTDAQDQFEAALQIRPDYAEAHCNLGNSQFARGQLSDAAAQYSEALRLQSNYFEAHLNLAMIFSQQGNDREAITHLRAALQQDPKAAIAMKKLAWILATCPDGTLRDGTEAVRLATQATQIDAADAQTWDALGAALAETGQFTEAVGAAKKALELCSAGPQQYLGPQIEARMALYEARQPFREKRTQPANQLHP